MVAKSLKQIMQNRPKSVLRNPFRAKRLPIFEFLYLNERLKSEAVGEPPGHPGVAIIQ